MAMADPRPVSSVIEVTAYRCPQCGSVFLDHHCHLMPAYGVSVGPDPSA
jgi:hypothetical protein